MSYRVTVSAMFVASLLAGTAGVAPCQSDLPSPAVVVGCLSERSGKLILIDKDGDTYILESHTSELRAHIGDELSVTGRVGATADGEGDHPLGVSRFETILRKNPAGVRPRLGDPRDWSTFADKSLGIVVRSPKAFLQQEVEPGWVRSNFVDPTGTRTLRSWSIPREVYGGSNFAGGSFEVAVDPMIRSEGTCAQFGSTTLGYTFSKTFGGIRYAQTRIVGAAAGTADVVYHLHTFQNGYCYGFTIEFDEADGTGMEVSFCTMQWLTNDNEQQLLDSLLSQVSFAVPGLKNAAKSIPAAAPLVTSVEKSLLREEPATQVAVSWSTEGADYVQLRYPCIEQLFVSAEGGGEMKCDLPTDRNFPPHGSETILLSNFNSRSVQLVLTVEPFVDGVAYHAGSKTILIEIAPDPHPRSDGSGPSLR